MNPLDIKSLIPAGLSLLPYQEEDVQFLFNRKRSLLASEPGTGKTPLYVVLASAYQAQRVVIVTPAVARSTVLHEWQTWDVLDRPAQAIHDGKTELNKNTQVIIISYDLSARDKWFNLLQLFLCHPRSMLICDEAQAVRKWEAKRTRRILLTLWPKAHYGLLVTGSPMYRGIMDLHPLFSSCEPDQFGTYDDFGSDYAFRIPDAYNPSGYRFIGTRNVPELKAKAKKFMVRRFQKDVQKDLPPRMFANVYLDVADSPDESGVDVAAVERAIEEGREPKDANMSQLKHELGVAKVPAICEWLENFIDEQPIKTHGPLVVFCYHKEVIAKLTAWAKQANHIVEAISGATPAKQRGDIITRFQGSEIDILFAQIDAAGTAINLFASNRCIFAELHYIPEALSQAIKRLHRMGQKSTVYIYFLLTENSIESKIIKLIRRKITDTKKVMGR